MRDTDQLEDWPIELRRVAELIGPELALKLGHDVGGLEHLYIPTEPTPTHPWVKSVGEQAFLMLVKGGFGGHRITLGRGHYVRLARKLIVALAKEGLNNKKIAVRCHCTERYVRRILKGAPKRVDPRQMGLFR
ncbi:MAG TPA: helix-turn-helix domain-containing protein [Polyangiaceae bacterium]|nr:helix-turn-helix domain-containing protein [Polyangiaceae bacterium]